MLIKQPQAGPPSALAAMHVVNSVLKPAERLFQLGGKKLLSKSAQKAVRETAELGAKALSGPAARFLGQEAAKTASKEIARNLGRAAGLGFVVDGAVTCVDTAIKVHSGRMGAAEAGKKIVLEGSTGALASAAGVAVVSGIVMAAGPIAAPAALGVAAGTSLATKLGLTELLS